MGRGTRSDSSPAPARGGASAVPYRPGMPAADTIIELTFPAAPELDTVRRHTLPFSLLVQAAISGGDPVVELREQPDDLSDDPQDTVMVAERTDATPLRQHAWYPLAEAVSAAWPANDWVVDEHNDGSCTIAYRFAANHELVLAAAAACGVTAASRADRP